MTGTPKCLFLLALLVGHCCLGNSDFRKIEFSLDSATGLVSTASATASLAARSGIECSTLCVAAASDGTGCRSWAFSAVVGRCFLSANRTFDFGAAVALGSDIYRGPVDIPTEPPTTTAAPASVFSATMANCTVMIGSRRFCVIQQRVSDKYSFAKNYSEYENGFGDSENYWIGLKRIHNLTVPTPRLIRVEALNLQNGAMYVSEFSSFSVAAASGQYKLSISGYLTGSSNTTGESFTYNNNLLFSAMDVGPNTGCSRQDGNAGWWFSGCTYVNPNGYFNVSEINNNGDNERFMQWRYAGPDGTRRMLRSIRLMLEV